MNEPLERIAVGSDHAGYDYKEAIKVHLRTRGLEVDDHGTDSTDPVDYPRFVRSVAEAVACGHASVGIVLGGSGNGEAMTANKVKGIRCALCWDTQTAVWAREHNDANIIAIGQRTVSETSALEIVDAWLNARFLGGRHANRVRQIEG